MSRENMEVMRSVYGAVLGGDLNPLFGLLDDEAEYVNPDVALESGIRRGRVDVEAAIRRLLEAFVYTRLDLERLLDVGNHVVAVLDVEGQGRDSQAPFRTRFGHLVTFRDGKIIRFEWFLDPDDALEAVGLRE